MSIVQNWSTNIRFRIGAVVILTFICLSAVGVVTKPVYAATCHWGNIGFATASGGGETLITRIQGSFDNLQDYCGTVRAYVTISGSSSISGTATIKLTDASGHILGSNTCSQSLPIQCITGTASVSFGAGLSADGKFIANPGGTSLEKVAFSSWP
jgi:hypothetical protein